jgi:excisionase family DNA binding protein
MDQERDILTSTEAARLLRVRVETVIREVRAGRLPGRRVGKEWRFSRAGLLEWLSRGADEEDLARYRRPGPMQPAPPPTAADPEPRRESPSHPPA